MSVYLGLILLMLLIGGVNIALLVRYPSARTASLQLRYAGFYPKRT